MLQEFNNKFNTFINATHSQDTISAGAKICQLLYCLFLLIISAIHIVTCSNLPLRDSRDPKTTTVRAFTHMCQCATSYAFSFIWTVASGAPSIGNH